MITTQISLLSQAANRTPHLPRSPHKITTPINRTPDSPKKIISSKHQPDSKAVSRSAGSPVRIRKHVATSTHKLSSKSSHSEIVVKISNPYPKVSATDSTKYASTSVPQLLPVMEEPPINKLKDELNFKTLGCLGE